MTFFFTSTILFCFISLTFSLSTVSISETSNKTIICALTPSTSHHQFFLTTVSLKNSGVVAGDGFVCAMWPSSSNSSIMGCWRFTNGPKFLYKRLYRGPSLSMLDAGNSHVCAIVKGNKSIECWQWNEFNWRGLQFSSIAVGEDFVCGLKESGRILCLGDNTGVVDHVPVGNYSLVASGFNHACAIALDTSLECWGSMMAENPQGVFSSLALGENRSCGLLMNGTVVCWGENDFRLPESLRDTYFVAIEAKRKVFCGVLQSNYSLYCWGNQIFDTNFMVFEEVLPGSYSAETECLPGSCKLCNQGYIICSTCENKPAEKVTRICTNSVWNRKMVGFLVVGCIGSFAILLICCFLLFKYCNGIGFRVHDSGRLDETGELSMIQPDTQQAQPVLSRRLSHLISLTNGGQLEEFSLQELLKATDNFSEYHKIGAGSFGLVYRATLDDNREVAIKRAEISSSGYNKHQEDKDSAFINELESLSRLHHKNLVRLFGFCEDNNELVLVYKYMNNGTLYDHLHKLHNSPLNSSWANRLKVALDAARGIEYLHIYAIPTIIHRDIKSSNILLDDSWTAKVSDFGLSLMGPKDDESHLSLMAAGTMGYIDPEYYRLQHLTSKSDVYSFGVVLLELLSGYRAIIGNKNELPMSVVDVVVPYITTDEFHKVLDPHVPTPTPFEIQAVACVGQLAADCVNLQGRDRPTMTEIVNILERALDACLTHMALSRSMISRSLA